MKVLFSLKQNLFLRENTLKLKKKEKGFTLVEMLISVGIFIMTIMALSQIFISVIRSEQVAYALLNEENNLRNGLESVARTIRMGTRFDLSDDGQILTFLYKADNNCLQNNNCPSYQYQFTDVEGKDYLVLTVKTENDPENVISSPQELFAPEIEILSGRFYQIGDPNQYQQPSFLIKLQAQVTVRGKAYPLSVETAVTPRILNLP